MSLNVVTLAVAKKYTDNSISGITGTLAGKNCTIKSITEITGGNRVTFEWTADDSTTHTATMDVMNGKGIASISVNSSNHLIITYSDGTTADAGEIEITAAVDSVNGETGDVILTASDVDAYSKSEVDTALGNKADKATTLSGYGITDAYTKAETDSAITTAIEALDVSDTVVSGSYVTGVSETNGAITVTREAADTTPTDSSTKMVTSGGVKTYVDDSIGALDVTDTAVSGSYVTAVSETDGAISVTREASDSVPTEDSTKMVQSGGVYTDTQNVYAANGVMGAKNLFPNTATTQTIQNITITVNNDKSVTCNGTNSQSWDATLLLGTVTLKAGSYIISGCPSGGSSSTYWMNVKKNGLWYADNTGNDISLELSETAEISLTLSLESNITVSNIIFRPMIRLATDNDSTYQPYAETNYQLTHSKVDWESNGVLGAKNLLPNTAETQTLYEVTFTVNSDGSVTVNGTSTGTAYINVGSFTFENGKSYILSGCPSGGSASGYSLYAYSNSLLGRDIGDGVTIIGNGDTADIRISVPNGVTVSSLTFYPMIRLATDTDDTYQPYAMTNQQLTSSLTDLLNNGSTNSITEQTAFSDLTNGMTYHISSATSTTIWSGYAKLIHVIKYSSTRGVQIAYKMTSASDVSSAMAYRLCYDGTYSNWSIISATNQS